MTISANASKELLALVKRNSQSDSHEQDPNLPGKVHVRHQLDKKNQMSAMDKVIEFLIIDANWRFPVDRERNIVQTIADSSEGSFRIVVEVKEDLGTVMVHVFWSRSSP
jgi:hypothetical protein